MGRVDGDRRHRPGQVMVALRAIPLRTTLRAGERVRNHHITPIPTRGARVLREA
ncbi:MAG TPA: hypothetical protein VMG80_00685 [Solirubrobacteraceae bacterium]|nr:hypothetical protein [Solirubrobacteraceae bacterium]